MHHNPYIRIQFRGWFMDHHSQGNHSRFFVSFWGQCWWKLTFLPVDLLSKHWLSVLQSFYCSKSKKYWMTWNHQKNSWKTFMVEFWEKWLNCGCKLTVTIPFLPLIIKAKPSILIFSKVKPKMFFFAFWWYWISWLDIYKQICKILVLWGYSPLILSQTSNWKSNSEIYKCKFIKQVVLRWFKQWKKSVCWVCIFTQKGHTVDILPYSFTATSTCSHYVWVIY